MHQRKSVSVTVTLPPGLRVAILLSFACGVNENVSQTLKQICKIVCLFVLFVVVVVVAVVVFFIICLLGQCCFLLLLVVVVVVVVVFCCCFCFVCFC